ncbi:MAG: three-Cys-motif partner protein TcmP [Candidatus Melainabacteria bacterium]|jgi:three-Cys-motif partner protein
MGRDLFNKPFDEGTLVKLNLYKDYLVEWLPVFICQERIQSIEIYDFFAGPGKDCNENFGSPLITINTINKFEQLISEYKKGGKIKLVFNELNEQKFSQLSKNIESYSNHLFEYQLFNRDFTELFHTLFSSEDNLKNVARLIFIDQYGIKSVDQKIFKLITSMQQTDFIFFIASSYLYRHNSLADNLCHQLAEKIKEAKYSDVHREVRNHYKEWLPLNKTFYISSFSIKKNTNIYGLIFGTGHPLGIEKFLKVAWKEDPDRGEANYNIDKDENTNQFSLFTNQPSQIKKVEAFEKELKQNIVSLNLKTNKEIYIYTLSSGFLPKHANKVIKELIDKKIIHNLKTHSSKIHNIQEEQIILSDNK